MPRTRAQNERVEVEDESAPGGETDADDETRDLAERLARYSPGARKWLSDLLSDRPLH